MTAGEDPVNPRPPTVLEEKAGKRDTLFAAIIALMVFAIVSPFLRDSALDIGTEVALAALVVVTLVIAGFWVAARKHPSSLVVTDDEIRLEPGGADPTKRRIERSSGSLRLAHVGSARSRTLVLSSLHGDGQIPLHFIDRQEVLDACYDHGWDFGED